jgi:hypothetical protein
MSRFFDLTEEQTLALHSALVGHAEKFKAQAKVNGIKFPEDDDIILPGSPEFVTPG